METKAHQLPASRHRAAHHHDGVEHAAPQRYSRLDVEDSTQALQHTAGNSAVAQLMAGSTQAGREAKRSPVLRATTGRGTPLDGATRRHMESQFGRNFAAVRIHSGPSAAAAASSIGATAYTLGSDIVMPNGLDANNHESLHTLAHELTHVVQQHAGPVSGTSTGQGFRVSDPRDRYEQEAERTASRIMTGLTAQREVAAPPARESRGIPALQRTSPVVQGLFGIPKAISRPGAMEIENIGDSLKSGYNAGRNGVPDTTQGRSTMGSLLKGYAKGIRDEPGSAVLHGHRAAGFWGSMGLGMVGRAAKWAPDKFGWTGGAGGAVNF